MSNNHQPYRRYPVPAPNEHARPSYSSSGSDNNQHFYRQPLEPPPLSSQHSSSYAPSQMPGLASDGALNILRSCGLEPTDLSLLAELPEDALTLDSLPHLLKQIKVRRGGGQTLATPPAPPSSFPSSSSSNPPRSASRQVTASFVSSGEWDKLRTQPIQYPLDHVRPAVAKSRPLPPEQVQDWQDRWGNPRQTGTLTHKTSTSAAAPSSSGYVVDYSHKDRAAAGLYDRVGPSSAASASRESTKKPPSLFSLHLPPPHEHNAPYSRKPPPATAPLSSQQGVVDYRNVPPPPNEYRNLQPRRVSPCVGQPSLSQKQPSRKVALDFHGTPPVTYPYSCSLCDITVLSEKVWNLHVKSPQHADGQLTVLQQFPDWDCRLVNNRSDEQPQRPKNEERPAPNKNPNKNTEPKRPASGKVISAKFVAHSVDEAYLRSVVETFGKVVKVILFPSLAFVEMGTAGQARDLVKWHSKNPVSAGGQAIIFDHSSTFNFLQSSRVVSFSPTPSGEDNIFDLMTVVKRFGPPLYTLFLPSKAFVEMKLAPDAQKLVDYYSANVLKINDVAIKVFFSGEYNTLMRVPKAKKFEEEEFSRSARRSRSPRSAGRTRSRSPRSARRSRSPYSAGRSRSPHSARRSRSPRSAGRSRSPPSKRRRSTEDIFGRSLELVSQKETRPEADRPTQPETTQSAGHQEDEVISIRSEEDSDIEGMEVLGEDGDFVNDSDEEIEEKEGDGQAQATAVNEEMEVTEQSTGTSTEAVKESEAETVPVPEEDMEAESETDFPIDLSSCITLDELAEEETEEEETCGVKDKEQGTKVLYFKNLPFKFYTDNDFLSIVKDYGKVSRYFLIRNRREGFIEMCSASDAKQAAKVLTSKTLEFNGSVLLVQLSHKYKKLTAGWKVDSDSDEEKRDSDRSKRSSRRLSSKRKRTENEEENERGKREESTREAGKGEENRKEEREAKTTEEGKEGKIKETEAENREEKGESQEGIKETGEEENREEIKETGEEIKETRLEENRLETGVENIDREETGAEDIKEIGVEENREEIMETGEETKETRQEENRLETGEENIDREETGAEDIKEAGVEENREEIKETGEEIKETRQEENRLETGEENIDREETGAEGKRGEVESDSVEEKRVSDRSRRSSRRLASKRKTTESEEDNRREERGKREESTREAGKEKGEENRKEEREAKITEEGKESRKEGKIKDTEEENREKGESQEGIQAIVEEEIREEIKETGQEENRLETGVENTNREETGEEEKTKETGEDEYWEEMIKETGEEETGEENWEEIIKETGGEEMIKETGETMQEDVASSEPGSECPRASNKENPEVKTEVIDEPIAEPVQPTKPVGTEFVRPVVGYFCNLCQVIYADEEEAKSKHCSTLEHYNKYQEQTGRDPWTM